MARCAGWTRTRMTGSAMRPEPLCRCSRRVVWSWWAFATACRGAAPDAGGGHGHDPLPGRRQECLLEWAGLAARGLPRAAPRGPAGPRPRPAVEGPQGHLRLRGGSEALLASAAGRHAGRRVAPVTPGAGSLLPARGWAAEGHRGLARRRRA
eukprot:6609584-Pyramimonas_sp.AAC.1